MSSKMVGGGGDKQAKADRVWKMTAYSAVGLFVYCFIFIDPIPRWMAQMSSPKPKTDSKASSHLMVNSNGCDCRCHKNTEDRILLMKSILD